MGEPIEERGGQLLVASEDGDPLGEGEIGRHDGGAAFIAVGDQIEEQLAADAIEGDEAELVDLCGAPHKAEHFLAGGAASDRSDREGW